MHARLLLTALLLLAAQPASARWYQVEVVVFEHTDEAASGDEQWPELAVLPDYSQAQELLTDIPAMADEPVPAGLPQEPVAFTPLARNEMRLAAVEQRLRNARGYHPLFVTGWRQPSFGVASPRRVYVSDLGISRAELAARTASLPPPAVAADGTPLPGALTPAMLGPKVEGTVAIKVGRLLDIDIDLTYFRDGVPMRMQEGRNIKLREVHYFDHPLFGVIVQVTPFVLPDVPATMEVTAEEPSDENAPPSATTPDGPAGGATAPGSVAPAAPPIPQAPAAPVPAVR